MGLESYILGNKADRVERVSRAKPEGNLVYWSLTQQGEIVKDWEEGGNRTSRKATNNFKTGNPTKISKLPCQINEHPFFLSPTYWTLSTFSSFPIQMSRPLWLLLETSRNSPLSYWCRDVPAFSAAFDIFGLKNLFCFCQTAWDFKVLKIKQS